MKSLSKSLKIVLIIIGSAAMASPSFARGGTSGSGMGGGTGRGFTSPPAAPYTYTPPTYSFTPPTYSYTPPSAPAPTTP